MCREPGALRIVPNSSRVAYRGTIRSSSVVERHGDWTLTAERLAMHFIETLIGVTAAMLSSLSYIPQVKKVWSGQPTEDLSSRTLIALTCGLALWVVYGAIKPDWIIVVANSAGAALTGYVLFHKLREQGAGGKPAPGAAE